MVRVWILFIAIINITTAYPQLISAEKFPSQAINRDVASAGFQPNPEAWEEAFSIGSLTPKRKIGGLVRFNDPSFFYAVSGRLVTNHGRFKRHRTFMFPHLRMEQYPYALRVRMLKRDTHPVRAGLIFGAKTPFEFEMGSEKSHGALFAYVDSHRVEFRDHRTYGTTVWKGASYDLSAEWREGDEIVLELVFEEGDPFGHVSARVTGAVKGQIPPTAIDLGKPDEMTAKPHIRGKGFFGFAVSGRGEVEILEIAVAPVENSPQMEGLEGYLRPCEWCVLKENGTNHLSLTFALREARLTSVSYRQGGMWSPPSILPETSNEREGGHTMYTHTLIWSGTRPDRYRLAQGGTVIYEGRVPPDTSEWEDGRQIVGIAAGGNEVWRYKQQNQLNWHDSILTQHFWQGDPPETFGPFSHNMGSTGHEFIKYQGVDFGWPDFLFAGDDYPGYPDNPILPLSELDYQQRMWDVFATSEGMREFHGNVPSAFKGGDHEFANSDQLQPGGFRGELYPAYIKNAYRAVALEGHTPIHPDEMSYISRPVPGWIEVFHMVTRFNQTVAVHSTDFPQHVDKVTAQSPSGRYVLEKLEEWARSSPAPFKIVHQDHPLGDIRDVSSKESYRLYPWERGKMIRLLAETGLIYAMGDEHNLRLVRYTDFSNASPPDPRLEPLKDMSLFELGISNLSGEWFRHVRENVPSTDGFLYEVLYQSVPKTERIGYDGFQVRNGYTVLRFNRDARTFDFEIWQRKGKIGEYLASDPRSDTPNFRYSIDPKQIFWRASMLPDVDLKDHGVPSDQASNMAFSVKDKEGNLLHSNRADSNGWIRDMPCPPLLPGQEAVIETASGKRIPLRTQ